MTDASPDLLRALRESFQPLYEMGRDAEIARLGAQAAVADDAKHADAMPAREAAEDGAA